jgi:hypothetical protein
MQDTGKLPPDRRKKLLQWINSHSTLEDRDVDQVIEELYGGDIDKYLLDMIHFGLPDSGNAVQL